MEALLKGKLLKNTWRNALLLVVAVVGSLLGCGPFPKKHIEFLCGSVTKTYWDTPGTKTPQPFRTSKLEREKSYGSGCLLQKVVADFAGEST